MILKYLKYLDWKGKIQLLAGSFFYKLFNKIPKEVFEIRNFIEAAHKKNYYIVTEPSTLVVSNKEEQFSLRKGTSDIKVFKQIILNEEFKNAIELIKNHNIKIERILDAGANIGLTTIYLRKEFEAKVLCIEPDIENYKQLLKNIKLNNIQGVEIIHGGVWSKNDFLKIDHSFRDGREWARRLIESEEGRIPVYTILDLLNKKGWESIDLLKMDIEGAEEVIFSNSTDLSFLDKTKIITIEIHDMFEVGHRIVEVLQKYNFKLYFSGELTIGIKR